MLSPGDHRAEIGVIEAPAEAQLPEGVEEPADQLVVEGAVDDDPGPGRARLAGVLNERLGDHRHALVEVGVGQHDAGRLAAQLQGDGRDVPGRRPHDETAGLQTAGERHVVDVVAGGQVGAGDLAATGDDVEGA